MSFQALDQVREQADPAIQQAKDVVSQAQTKAKALIDDVTGGASGGNAVKQGLDKDTMMDSGKLAAVSDLLANALGSGRL